MKLSKLREWFENRNRANSTLQPIIDGIKQEIEDQKLLIAAIQRGDLEESKRLLAKTHGIPEARIVLREPHIRALIRGGEVTVKTDSQVVKMILSDIGFDLIEAALDSARDGRDHYVGYEDEQ